MELLTDWRPLEAAHSARAERLAAARRQRAARGAADPVEGGVTLDLRLGQAGTDAEQPGCRHANMDCFTYARKLGPACPGSLLLDTFELALAIRRLDMAGRAAVLRGRLLSVTAELMGARVSPGGMGP